MKKSIFLFDVDGTLVESGQKISQQHANILNKLKENPKNEIGIVGGGDIKKIICQMDNKIYFNHYFSECGCVYHTLDEKENKNNLEEKYKKNIRNHNLYLKINILIKKALEFLSRVDYTLTGNFIDLRCGIIYISLIGMSATNEEREYFKTIDKKEKIREQLLEILLKEAEKINVLDKVSILEGGSVGISIYPIEYDKIQVLETIKKEHYDNIYYFGDKYLSSGNDYHLINHKDTIGYKINNIENTYEILQKII